MPTVFRISSYCIRDQGEEVIATEMEVMEVWGGWDGREIKCGLVDRRFCGLVVACPGAPRNVSHSELRESDVGALSAWLVP